MVEELENGTRIEWSDFVAAGRSMTYESLDLLYKVSSPQNFEDEIGLILACSPRSIANSKALSGFLHKVEIKTLPDVAHVRIAVTHEVRPGLEGCSQIIPVNHKLKVAGFDSGCIIPVKNFGYKKTFNSEVPSRLTHHIGQVCCIASNSGGDKLASGCTGGIVTIYQVRSEEVSFLSRTGEQTDSIVTAMSFLKSDRHVVHDDNVPSAIGHEYLLVSSTNYGRVNLLDTRCNLAEPIEMSTLIDVQPRFGITSLLHPRSSSGSMLYVGGSEGQLIIFDLRMRGRVLNELKAKSSRPIRRMKEVVISEGSVVRTFMAFSNSTNEIEILDLETMMPHDKWICDKRPKGMIRDLIQVDDRIITCGDEVSLGSWCWDRHN